MKPAHHHVVTGFDADGAPTPVMAKITCQKDGEPSIDMPATSARRGTS